MANEEKWLDPYEFPDKNWSLDLIKDPNMSDLNKTLLIGSITHFTYCNLAELNLKMQGKTDFEQTRSSLLNRLDVLKKLEAIVKAFDKKILSEQADWYFELGLRMPLIRDFIKKNYELIDFTSVLSEEEIKRKAAEELFRQDELSDLNQ